MIITIEHFTFEAIECPQEISQDIKVLTEVIDFLNL